MHWRTLASVAMLLAAVPAVEAKGHLLHEKLSPGDCFRVELSMTLEGTMHFSRGDKKTTMPLKASATHLFPERVLSVAKTGTAEKTARVYETAKATIQAGKHTSERTLRPERKLFIAQWQNDQPLAYSPSGPLFRSELELCSEHFDTLHLAALLPGKEVNVGGTWKIANVSVQALCHFDGLTEQALIGKLERVEGGKAIVSVKGTAQGIEVGSMVKLTIDAVCEFDLEAKRLVKVTWKQKDDREMGPANPASKVESTTTIARKPIAMPDALSDAELKSVPEGLSFPPRMLELDYVHPKNVYSLLYLRDWTIVSETDNHLVMRLVDRGDFVAQVTVAVWTKTKPGKTMTPAEFVQVMEKTQDWKVTKELQVGEVPADKDTKIYRLSQLGQLDGAEMMQNFYLVAFEDGRQVVLTFTMTPKQADRLGTRDLTLAGSIDFGKAK
jgi:hypothetical protein